MLRKNNLRTVRHKTISILDKYLDNNYLLFLFGSFAKKNIDKISDIDLAIYAKDAISSAIILEAKEELESKAGTLRNIDLINLTDKNVTPALQENILKEGLIWKKPKNSKELLRSLKRHLRNLKS